MLKKLHFWLTALVLALAGPAFAQRTVTFTNYNFEDGDPIDNTVVTYAKDTTNNNTSYSQLQEVTGWTHSTSGDAMAGAVFAYGDSVGLGSSTYYPPTTDPDGGEGQCLGVVAVWTATAYYASEVTLAPGEYTVTIPVYNGSGTASITNLSGVTLADGTSYTASSTTYSVGEWTTETLTFTLEEATTATITLGYTAPNSGSGSCPHLFYDEVAISYEPVTATVEEGDYYFKVSDEYKYLSRGGSWGTELVIDPVGILFTLVDNGDGTFYLESTDRREAGFTKYYVSGPTSAYADASSYSSWSLEEAGDDTYYIVNSNGNYLCGADYTYGSYTYTYISETSDPTAAPAFELLSRDEYKASLADRLDDQAAAAAESAGLSLASVAEIEEAGYLSATDKTESIQNPDYAATDGWSVRATNSNRYKTSISYGYYCAEIWESAGEYYQTVTGLPEGLYKVTANSFNRMTNLSYFTSNDGLIDVASVSAYLYTETSETKNITSLGFYDDYSDWASVNTLSNVNDVLTASDTAWLQTMYVYVPEDGELTLGFVADGYTEYAWNVVANWTLTLLEPVREADLTVTASDPTEATEDEDGNISGTYTTYTGVSAFTFKGDSYLYVTTDTDVSSQVSVTDSAGNSLACSIYNARGTIYVELDESITESGWYYVYLPEGAIVDYDAYLTEYGHVNAEATFAYYISVEAPEFYSDPESGSTVSSLSTIEITCSTGYLDANYWASDDAVITDADGNEIATISISDYSYNSDYTGVVYTLEDEIVKAGTYTLTFPAGVFAIDADSWNEYYDSEVIFTYIVDGSEEPAYYITADPEEGSTVKSLSTISITFDDYTNAIFSGTAYVYEASDYEENGTSATMVTYSNSSSYDGNTITIGLKAEVTENGDYVVVIKSGKISLSSDNGSSYTNTTEAIELYYTVKGVPTGMSVDPADESTIEELSSIVISFPDATELTFTSYPYIFVYEDEDHTTTYYGPDASTSMGCTPTKGSYVVDGTTVTITFNYSTTEAGDYYVRFPSGYFTVDGESVEEVILHYIIEDTTSDGGDDDEDDTTTVTISGVTLTDGGSYEGLTSGETVQFSIEPASSVGYAFYKIGTTEGGADLKSRSSLTYNSETGYWESELYADYTFESGTTYYITVAAYATENDYNYGNDALAELSYTITGSGEASSMSSVTLTSLYPANESEIDTSDGDLSVLLAFSDKVNINSTTSFLNLGQGVTYDFSSITGDSSTTGEDGLEYSDYWTLVVDEAYYSVFTDGLTLTVVATDEEGNRVYDSDLSQSEDPDYTYFLIEYSYAGEASYLSIDALTITEEDGVVTIASTDGSTLGLGSGTATLYDADGNVVAEKLDGESNFDWDTWTGGDAYVYDLSEYITDSEATYTLVIPAGAITDSEGNGYDEITVTIGSSSEEDEDLLVAEGDYYFQVDGEYKFWTRGGNWGTEAIKGENGVVFTVISNGDGTYTLQTRDRYACGDGYGYLNGPTSVYTDQYVDYAASWSFEEVGDGSYYIVNSNGNYVNFTELTYNDYCTYYYTSETSDQSSASTFTLLSEDEYEDLIQQRTDEQAAAAAEAAGIDAETEDALAEAEASLTATDYTDYIVDADCSAESGWTFAQMGYCDGTYGAYNSGAIETWNAPGTGRQTISGLPEGLYKLTAQAFSMPVSITTVTDVCNGSYLFASTASSEALKLIYKVEGDEISSTSLSVLADAEDETYLNTLYIYVAEGEDLEIGYVQENRCYASWTAADNWTLTLLSASSDEDEETGISSISADATFEPTTIYSVSGQLVRTQATSFDGLNKGIYIVGGKKVLVK